MDDIETATSGFEEDMKAVHNVANQVPAFAKQTNLLALNATIKVARGRCRQGVRRRWLRS